MKKLPDEYFDDDNTPRHGKKPAQKLKPYVVLQFLLKNTDENHLVDADDIVAYLKESAVFLLNGVPFIKILKKSILSLLCSVMKLMLMKQESN